MGRDARTGRRRARLGGAALLVIAAATVAVLDAWDDQDDSRTDAAVQATPTTSTTSAAPPAADAGSSALLPLSVDDGDWIGRADLVAADADEVVLVTFSGEELARGPRGDLRLDHPERGVDFDTAGAGITLTPAPVLDPPIDGCPAVHGAALVRAAVCGREPDTDEIRLVSSDGTSRLLTGPAGEVGHWQHAIPSPGGNHVLAQWSTECEVPQAYLIDVATTDRRLLSPAGAASVAVGWAPDGQAIVSYPDLACGSPGPEPGTYLVEPSDLSRRKIHAFSEAALFTKLISWRANRLERVMARAHDHLGLEAGGGQPSHGGGDVEDGIVFEGHEVGVYGVPLDEHQPLDDTAERYRFRCGDDLWYLNDYGPAGAYDDSDPDRALLARAANALIPGLYCTRASTG